MAPVLSDQNFLESIKNKGFEPAVLIGEPFAQFVSADLKVWRAIANQANIELDIWWNRVKFKGRYHEKAI